MKQETIKKIMEQLRSKENGNNEAKESVEEETMATMNMRSTTQESEGFEATLNSNIATLNTYWYQFSPYPLNLMGTGGAVVGYLASTNYYYLAEFTMSLQTVPSGWNLTKERLTRGYLVFTPELLAPGYSQFDITTKSNQLLSSWNSIDGWSGAGTGGTSNNKTIVLPMSSIYDEESDTVCFKLWPYSHSTSIAGFPIEDMKLIIETQLVGIAITTPPAKTVYLEGETFDPNGMVVTATYSDGSTAEVSGYTYSPNGALTASDTSITISYTESGVTRTATQAITVDNAGSEEDPVILTGIEITTQPAKTVYLEGETFDSNGMVVTATYSDGSTAEVTGYYSPDGALTASDTSITISYTEGGETKTATQEITVDELKYENAPYVRGSSIQNMDIYIPKNTDGTYKAGLFPAVITIHGGGWAGGDKATSHYHNNTDNNNDMSDFITNTCNCVHVNMNYRLTKDNQQPTGFTYMHMLEDIESAIAYLQSHAAIYQIAPDKIALMGYSAGGHLALLYAYMAKQGYYNYGDKIKLVISEAGPTYFATSATDSNPICTDDIQAMVGSDNTEALYNASPLTYVDTNAPYTILAYGKIYDENNNLTDTDGTVPYSQAQALETQLSNNGVQYDLYELIGVGHGDFGVDMNGDPKIMHSESTKSGTWNQAREDYYEKLEDELN